MLEWMGKKKVVNHHNDVPFHVLERKYSFRKNSDKSEATLTLRKTRNVSGASDESELKNRRDDKYLLGVAFGVAYYFCYEKNKSMMLNRAMLKKIKTKAESYVIYADACTLSSEELEKLHITFKKIPRDVTRF